MNLLTRGSPLQVTGGHLYHRRMAEAAPSRDARIEFVSVGIRNPLGRCRTTTTPDVTLVDSLAAASVVPWVLGRRRGPDRLAAILHQPPGGVGQGAARTTLQRPVDQLLYQRCELLIAASTALAHELVDTYGLPAGRVRVAEPGSDVPVSHEPPPDLRRGRRIAALCVANWLPNKGVLELLEAVAALPADDVTLHLAGRDDVDAHYTRRVQDRIGNRDLIERVVVHGPLNRDDVARLYAGADVFVLASFAETYGTVFAEALNAGLPTVGWRSGNLPHLIHDGEHGCLVTPGDVAGLSGVLRRLATEDSWRNALASAARRRGSSLPRWTDTADAFFGALHELVSRRA